MAVQGYASQAQYDDRSVRSWVSGILDGKSPASVGIPKEVAQVYGELVSRGLTPDEMAVYKGLTGSRASGRLGGSGLLTEMKGRDLVESKRALSNKLCGYMLAALCRVSPQAAADGLCTIFEPVFKTESQESR